MDAFEQIVALILDGEGYWTRTSFKVDLTKEEKRIIGRPSSPRWEIDLIAYRPADNLLLAVECKSYLDSLGVDPKDLLPDGKSASRYKLFNDKTLREIVLNRLSMQLMDMGMAVQTPQAKLCLAAGKTLPNVEEVIEKQLAEQGHEFYGPRRIFEWLLKMADRGYENEVATVVAKIIWRNPQLAEFIAQKSKAAKVA